MPMCRLALPTGDEVAGAGAERRRSGCRRKPIDHCNLKVCWKVELGGCGVDDLQGLSPRGGAVDAIRQKQAFRKLVASVVEDEAELLLVGPKGRCHEYASAD